MIKFFVAETQFLMEFIMQWYLLQLLLPQLVGKRQIKKKKQTENEKTLFSLVQECVGQREPLPDIADMEVLEWIISCSIE